MCKIMSMAFGALMLAIGTYGAAADGLPRVYHKKVVHHGCRDSYCGLYLPCGATCTVCPDRYSCFPLYGAYGPFGGTAYWGAYTLTGWGYRW
jgi:hypothetical protein